MRQLNPATITIRPVDAGGYIVTAQALDGKQKRVTLAAVDLDAARKQVTDLVSQLFVPDPEKLVNVIPFVKPSPEPTIPLQ